MFLFIDFCTCSWLIPWLLPFLLGLLLGWLIWGRLKNRIEELEAENAKLRAQISGLEHELSECNAKNAGIDSEIALLKGRIREYESVQTSGSLGIMSDTGESDHDVQIDVDGDGDADIEGDIVAGGIDIDGDGVADIEGEVEGEMVDIDVDLDGDGIADVSGEVVEGGLDIDGDGEADIEGDLVEGGLDIDGDGDADIGSDIVDGGIDTDGDGKADIRTADAGIGDAAMAGTTALGAMSGAGRGSSRGKNIYGALKEDNLQIVEGIGPKMNEILNDHGVNTWAQLAGKSTSDLRGILDSVNPVRYRIIDPSSWHEQARLAVEGNWDALIALQKNLDSGRRAGAIGETDSKVEKMLIKLGVLKKWKKDDLTAIEGIGPKISQLLKDNGITTWRELANTSVAAIQTILDAGGKRFKLADPGSWPKQAEMAADGRWDDLEEYQDFLQGGK